MNQLTGSKTGGREFVKRFLQWNRFERPKTIIDECEFEHLPADADVVGNPDDTALPCDENGVGSAMHQVTKNATTSEQDNADERQGHPNPRGR